jgi:hypothetical protein
LKKWLEGYFRALFFFITAPRLFFTADVYPLQSLDLKRLLLPQENQCDSDFLDHVFRQQAGKRAALFLT